MRDPVKSVRLRLSRNVQHVRRLRGLSQERLAELAAISLKQIGRVERGEVNVTLDVVARIAAGLRVDLCDLLESDTDRNAVVLVPAQDLESVEKLLSAPGTADLRRAAPAHGSQHPRPWVTSIEVIGA